MTRSSPFCASVTVITILLNPPLTGMTAFLWAAPFAMLVIGAAGVVLFRRRKTDGGSLDPDRARDAGDDGGDAVLSCRCADPG